MADWLPRVFGALENEQNAWKVFISGQVVKRERLYDMDSKRCEEQA